MHRAVALHDTPLDAPGERGAAMTRHEGGGRLRRRVEQGLWIIGAICLASCAYTIVEAGAYQTWQGLRLRGLFGGTASRVRGEAEATGLIGRIAIDRIGLSAIVTEGVGASVLRRAVGHLPGTPFPGEPGNAVMAGHRDTFFRGLRHVRRGDTIHLAIPDGEFDNVVESTTVVTPDRVDLLRATPSPTLTLITCYPFRYIGRAPKRFVVRASLAADRHDH